MRTKLYRILGDTMKSKDLVVFILLSSKQNECIRGKNGEKHHNIDMFCKA